jgi:hypothetical protein
MLCLAAVQLKMASLFPLCHPIHHYHCVFEWCSFLITTPKLGILDPLLLAVRAAVIWSWRINQKLLAAVEIPEEDEFDILAHEQYLMRREHSHHPKLRDDLARSLHQQNGYDETKVDSVSLFEQDEKDFFFTCDSD